MKRSLIMGAIVTTASVGLAQPALAVAWASSSSPLKAYEGGVAQAAAYGQYFKTADITRSYVKSNYRDLRSGGNGVYVNIEYYSNADSCAGQKNCVSNNFSRYDGSDQTSRSSSGRWVYQEKSNPLNGQGTASRGFIKVCEDQAWQPDPCSRTSYPTFNY